MSDHTNEPKRGFTRGDFETRLTRAQAAMTANGMDALVVTAPPNVRYFSGFATQFWESPTRPWFVVVPREGHVIAVIPEIGAPGMALTWVDDIRTWSSPQPEDDGLSLLGGVLEGLPRRFGRIGWEMGREQVIRMPIKDFDMLRNQVSALNSLTARRPYGRCAWSNRRPKWPISGISARSPAVLSKPCRKRSKSVRRSSMHPARSGLS